MTGFWIATLRTASTTGYHIQGIESCDTLASFHFTRLDKSVLREAVKVEFGASGSYNLPNVSTYRT